MEENYVKERLKAEEDRLVGEANDGVEEALIGCYAGVTDHDRIANFMLDKAFFWAARAGYSKEDIMEWVDDYSPDTPSKEDIEILNENRALILEDFMEKLEQGQGPG